MSGNSTSASSLPVTVEKPIPVTYDMGNLAVFDTNTLDKNDLDSSNGAREEHLKSLTRDNMQLMINQILSLPIKTTTEATGGTSGQSATVTLIQLPQPTTELPREKPLPKPKAPTKWELFAAKKNIKPKERAGKMVYDEASGEWAPKWGYKGINKKLDDQWLVEVDDKVKGTDDELIDPRTLSRAERKKLIKKNELQHKRNLKNSMGLK
ncbi:ribosome biogenesis protein RRS1 Ecym_2460 [Eremothecium cymbalariae DBVPG|uniref:Ribosome biogenesis regulatory protein n=1 Tax=Eremothecium cymbalariae (strain CBS 270.75 / DBVPG 7215 / KCTC 17166 / NRRL Y-17582) TaxID=931890 RepID=G8JPS9_ERECY|nr:Hypothetical protein Ecym_2460 [Eremothecium cymbalariae DBVPG\